MKTIKHIFERYSAFFLALLKPLGCWGVFAISAMDGAALGLPMDLIVATYVYQDPSRFLLYVIMASAGSAVGCSALYLVGYLGGEKVLRKRITPERFEKIHRAFDRHEFWALMFPTMLPPPMPFKPFVLAAAVFEMNFGHFLLAIFAGRFVRFSILALLTLKFGPQFVAWSGKFFGQHFIWMLGAAAEILLVWWFFRRRSDKKKSAVSEQSDTATTTPSA